MKKLIVASSIGISFSLYFIASSIAYDTAKEFNIYLLNSNVYRLHQYAGRDL